VRSALISEQIIAMWSERCVVMVLRLKALCSEPAISVLCLSGKHLQVEQTRLRFGSTLRQSRKRYPAHMGSWLVVRDYSVDLGLLV
jgi:hypothetical protein